MASRIITKKGSGAPLASDLVHGELAVDTVNKRLYTENAGGTVVELGTNPTALTIGGTALTATATELNVLDGITATTAELNILDGVTATTAELNYTDGVTSNIQTQLNTKAPIDDATFTGTTTITTADINGGTIDDTVIGGTTPAAGSFTTGQFDTSVNVDGTVTVDVADGVEPMRIDTNTSTSVDAITFLGNQDQEATIKFHREGSTRTGIGLATSVAGVTTEALRVTSDLNVGIGTSSPVSELDVAGVTPTLTIKDTQNKSWTGSDTTLGELAFRTSDSSGIGAHNVAFVRATNDVASATTPSGALSFGVSLSNNNASEKMRLNSDGELLVGTTNSSVFASTTSGINVAGNNGFIGTSRGGAPSAIFNRHTSDGDIVELRKDGTTVGSIGTYSGDLWIGQGNTGLLFNDGGDVLRPANASGGNRDGNYDLGASDSRFKDLYLSGSTFLSGPAASTFLRVGADPEGASSSGTEVKHGTVVTSTDSSLTRTHNQFRNPNGVVGSITTNGSGTAYNTSSDYRLKENVVDMAGAVDRVKALPVRRFNFIADPDTTVDGFIAHEAQEIVPESVTGKKDHVEEIGNITDADSVVVQEGITKPIELLEGQTWAKTGERPVMQGIDQAKLVPLLTGALKEAIARIETLEAEVATLKGAN